MGFPVEQGLNLETVGQSFFATNNIPAGGVYGDSIVDLGFVSQGFKLDNRGANIIEYSTDGVNNGGRIYPTGTKGDVEIFDFRRTKFLYFRSTLGSTVEITAW